jgi:Holliday junction resolvase RusA-like endonuclease
VEVELIFYIPRPNAHYRSGKHADDLRDSAPKHHVSTPDVDNLAKAVMDCMTRLGFWRDDSQVTTVSAHKLWCGKQGGGARISIRQVEP